MSPGESGALAATCTCQPFAFVGFVRCSPRHPVPVRAREMAKRELELHSSGPNSGRHGLRGSLRSRQRCEDQIARRKDWAHPFRDQAASCRSTQARVRHATRQRGDQPL